MTKEQAGKIIKEFEENKVHNLEIVRNTISVGPPAFGSDLNELIKDCDNRMSATSYFLYYYSLMEINIKNYKEYSKPSNYDAETLEMIKENLLFNYDQYQNSIKKLKEVERDAEEEEEL